MTEREKMVKAVKQIEMMRVMRNTHEECADYLIRFLASELNLPPCKVGDTVWLTLELLKGGQKLVESRCVKITIISDRQIVYSMHINERAIGNTLEFYDDDFGKTVFLSREEAEKALKEREENEKNFI